MSPSTYGTFSATEYATYPDGGFIDINTGQDDLVVRPVINIKIDAFKKGTGTKMDPFRIE